MAAYQLSQKAAEDLLQIALFGDKHFGIAQSDRYRDMLKQRFSGIANQPRLYPRVDHIRIGYRRSVCGAHSIYYRIDSQNTVIIVRVLGHQDLKIAF